MGKLDGRVALVTGGNRGLGRSIVGAFVAEGAKVAFNYRSRAQEAEAVVAEAEAAGGTAIAIQADLTDEAAIATMYDTVESRLGPVDVLVNNAGIVSAAPILDMSTAAWDEMFDVHVRAMFLCTRRALPNMKARGYGKIVNMGGSFGTSGAENFVHMSAAKAAMIGFTRALAREVGPLGIYVNVLAPSMIEGETTAKMDPKFLDALRARYPLRKLGTQRDIAASALFLATEDSDFYTGQTLAPAGGEIMV